MEGNIKNRHSIWLCDLTHSFQTTAMNKMPLAIGMIASYCKKEIKNNISIRLFKFLAELSQEIKKADNPPLVVGFSNYIWNNNLNLEVSRRIKALYPESVIVFGGPNFPLDYEEQALFFKRSPWVDFYLPFEGEKSFSRLLKLLLGVDGNLKELKKLNPPQSIFCEESNLIRGELLPPLEVCDFPSPYLDGLFDGYFQSLVPLIQTTRGCPFSCTYCYDGIEKENKVRHRNLARLNEELEYIAKRCKRSFELYISDSNFGMYAHDIEFCKIIAKMQEEYSWPRIISVTTGKRHKERIYQAVRLTKGAMPVTVSVQSTDPVVLDNIKRQNMPLTELLSLAKETKKLYPDLRLYSDIILGLPEDTLKAHLKTIKDIIDDGSIDSVVPFQLMILPGTEMATRKSRDKYGMVTRYRVLPRCFGRYEWLGSDKNAINTAEIEEICISNNTMSFEEYLECRKFDLSVTIFYNEFIFSDLYRLLGSLGFSLFGFIQSLHLDAQEKMPDIYEGFIRETRGELWSLRGEIMDFIKQPDIMDKYLKGEYGSNLLFKYKITSYIKYIKNIIELMHHHAERLIAKKPSIEKEFSHIKGFLGDLKKLYYFLGDDFLNTSKSFDATFDYNVAEFITDFLPLNKVVKVRQQVRIEHSQSQRELIDDNKKMYGENLITVSKLIAQIPLKKLLRKVTVRRMYNHPGRREDKLFTLEETIN